MCCLKIGICDVIPSSLYWIRIIPFLLSLEEKEKAILQIENLKNRVSPCKEKLKFQKIRIRKYVDVLLDLVYLWKSFNWKYNVNKVGNCKKQSSLEPQLNVLRLTEQLEQEIETFFTKTIIFSFKVKVTDITTQPIVDIGSLTVSSVQI